MARALKFFTCIVLTVFIVASVDAEIPCNIVVSYMAPCVTYLRQGGPLSPICCKELRNLNGIAQTKPDRQQACRCVKFILSMISGLNPNLTAGLPGRCGVSLLYPFSMNTNCTNVKGSWNSYIIMRMKEYGIG
ncbi:Non-specific lipid-transfer protein 4 [Hirschfeldia incana]|nr:Non-specific lipid-transfer protein 4 [Hirschfeldia incana]